MENKINNKKVEDIVLIVEISTNDEFQKINNLPNASAVELNENFGLVVIPVNEIDLIKPYVKEIVRVDIPPIYTLQNISPAEASEAPLFNNNPYLSLNGKDVIIGILDTGIDYLSKEFQKEDDTTRILRLWDQTIAGNDRVYGLNLGTEYKEEDINKAINLKASGGDPYSIVPSKDEIGHGTMGAGLIGARGENPAVIGVAPKCDFVVVKMLEVGQIKLDEAGITNKGVGRYSAEVLVMSMRYLSIVASELKKPLVMYMPVGSNIGAHDGTSEVEGAIDTNARQLGVAVVNGTGNEGDTETHTEGVFGKAGEIKTIEIKVGKNQKKLFFNMYIRQPDRVSLSVVSPSGEVVEKINAKLDSTQTVKFVYEGTTMQIDFKLPDDRTGDEIITIKAVDIKEGIWQFRLHGDFIIDGRYWSWLPQRSLLDPETKFLNPTQYTTITVPATAQSAIVAAYYNQNNNATVGQSGRGFTRDERIKPDVAAGGINAAIVKPGGGVGVASGSSVASAILAGCCALVYEWGIVNGNDKNLYTRKLRSYIIRGAQIRTGDMHPNQQWGYGTLSMKGIFDAIRGNLVGGSGGTRGLEEYYEYNVGNLFVRKPI